MESLQTASPAWEVGGEMFFRKSIFLGMENGKTRAGE